MYELLNIYKNKYWFIDMPLFFIIFFSLYTIINSYIFVRGWQALSIYPQLRIFYAIIFFLFASSYIIARAFSNNLPDLIYTILIWIGSFYFMLMFYLFLLFLLADLIYLTNNIFRIFPENFYAKNSRSRFIVAFVISMITIVFAVYGYINRSNIKIKELDIVLHNPFNKNYRIVFFSDLHVSVVNNHNFLDNVVHQINSLEPDLILIGGDLIDEKSDKLRKLELAENLKNLNASLGVYSITGNHEYINGVDSTVKFLEDLGINFLRDEEILIDNAFYVVGREDRSISMFTKKERKSLKELIDKLDRDKPIILLDHQPIDLNEAVQHGITLQLSGHTHHGQIAPANLITKRVYELSWGYKRKGNSHFYVSSGIGTWGPPIKIGNDAEIVFINFSF